MNPQVRLFIGLAGSPEKGREGIRSLGEMEARVSSSAVFSPLPFWAVCKSVLLPELSLKGLWQVSLGGLDRTFSSPKSLVQEAFRRFVGDFPDLALGLSFDGTR